MADDRTRRQRAAEEAREQLRTMLVREIADGEPLDEAVRVEVQSLLSQLEGRAAPRLTVETVTGERATGEKAAG